MSEQPRRPVLGSPSKPASAVPVTAGNSKGARIPGGGGLPVTPARQSGAKKAPSPAPPVVNGGGGASGGMMNALVVLMVLGFGFLYFLAFQPDAVEARVPEPGSRVPNMKSLLAIGLSSGKNLTVSETEINGYLAATLQARQAGPLAGKAAIERVVIRLRDGEFQLVVVRRLFGRQHTVAVNLAPTQSGEGDDRVWSVQPAGGKVGRLPVAGALLNLVMAPVNGLAKVYSDELKILRHASSIRVEDGRVLLGPVIVRQ